MPTLNKLIVNNSVIDHYMNADASQKVDLILNHYSNFPALLSGYEESIKSLIIHERHAKKRREMGDTGVRVQTFHRSDRTAALAVEKVSLDEAIQSHDLSRELKDLEDGAEYSEVLDWLWNMREDYELVQIQVHMMTTNTNDLLEGYLNRDIEAVEFAESRNIAYRTMIKRLNRSRQLIKTNMEVFLNRKYAEGECDG